MNFLWIYLSSVEAWSSRKQSYDLVRELMKQTQVNCPWSQQSRKVFGCRGFTSCVKCRASQLLQLLTSCPVFCSSSRIVLSYPVERCDLDGVLQHRRSACCWISSLWHQWLQPELYSRWRKCIVTIAPIRWITANWVEKSWDLAVQVLPHSKNE